MAGTSNSGRKRVSKELMKLRGTERAGRGMEITVHGEKITQFRQCQYVQGYDTLNERQKKIFKFSCEQLIALKLLEKAYLPGMIFYAKEFDTYLNADADTERNGRYILERGASGEVIGTTENPSVKHRNKALENIIRLGSNYGFTPVDRQRIRMEHGNTADPKINMINIIMDGKKKEAPDDQ